MDHRRGPRAVADPKVRQVGFVTPGVSLPYRHQPSASADLGPAGSISPVMIPPPRPAALDAAADSGGMASSEFLVGSPPMMSTSSLADDIGSEFSDDVPLESTWTNRDCAERIASSLPARGGEMTAVRSAGNGVLQSSSGTALVVEKAEKEVESLELQTERSGDPKQKPKPSKAERRAIQEAQRTAKEAEKEKEYLEVQSERSGDPKQKPKTSKAERRAIQEAQRAAKAAAKEAGVGGKPPAAAAVPVNANQVKPVKPPQNKEGPQGANQPGFAEKKVVDRTIDKDRKKDIPQPRMQFDDIHRVEKAKRRAVVNKSEARNRVELFRHLPQYIHGTQLPDLESKFFQLDPVHPSVYKVGLQYLSGNISGGNARCISMLLAFKEAIGDYSTSTEKILVRDLTAKIGTYISFLIECRPLSISMGNAIRFLKNRIAKLPHIMSLSDVKSSLQSDIDRFINEKIVIADKVIVRHAVTKVRDGDVLLVYGSSSIVEMMLLYAHELGKKFRVVVVDSRPKHEGQSLLRKLIEKGINCTYTHVNALSYIMHEVTRVFLGAASVLSNGTIYSRVGTACVAMVAHAFQVPVLICCEAYKFHERVQLDSICSNELGDPDVISKVHGRKDLNHLEDWADSENLQLLNLTYDVTPSDYVSMIITDYGMIPPTSVPVIVREYRRVNLWI